MQIDESFQFVGIDHADFLMDEVAKEAAERYRNGESIQVITPRNETVDVLNRKMQAILNPVRTSVDGVKLQLVLNPGKRNETSFRDGDRVMMLENDRDRVYSNVSVKPSHVFQCSTSSKENGSGHLQEFSELP
jgi:ATP-dependent exoDNAse (exonuclease V) alpha subunit